MRNWFFNTVGTPGGDGPPHLWGASETIFSNPQDLITFRVAAEQDRLSSFIHTNLGIFFATSRPDGTQIYTSKRGIARFVAVFSTLLAAGLLFGAILSLRVTSSEKAVLGMLCGWMVLFAACVGLLTNAKGSDLCVDRGLCGGSGSICEWEFGDAFDFEWSAGNGTCICRIT